MSAKTLDAIIEGRRSQPQQLIEVLHDVQDTWGYVSQESMITISRELGVPLIEVAPGAVSGPRVRSRVPDVCRPWVWTR